MTQNDRPKDQLSSLARIDAAIHANLNDEGQHIDNSYGELRVLELRAQLISANDAISLRDSIIRSQTDRISHLVSERDAAVMQLEESAGGKNTESASFDNMLRYYATKSPGLVGRGLNRLATVLRSLANTIRG